MVLDFGSQFTQLIARRIRELGVFSDIRAGEISPDELELANIGAIVLSGGPASVTDEGAPQLDPKWLELGVPVLGICYGMQLLACNLEGKLEQGRAREYGFATLSVDKTSSLFSGFDLGEHVTVWMSHGDHVGQAPKGFEVLAHSSSNIITAIGNEERKVYGVQFHPEVVHTPRGAEILANFVFKIAGLEKSWTSEHFIEESLKRIESLVGAEDQVICGLSGGVDSTVAAALVHRAIGKRLHCIFVDTGMLRKHEGDEVERSLGDSGLGLQITRVNAEERFLSALKGVSDPEEKRKIIGREFVEVFDQEASKIKGAKFLLQGTLYPDVIESTSVRGPSAKIKTHHNVGGLPERMKLKLIEPLRELFKDEVRKLGAELGVPEDLLKRHPFPGPGLAVRVLGEITRPALDLLREADAIFIEEIRAAGLYDQIWQAFAVLLPVKSVGVMGDGRTYENVVALRAVTSQDGMTADWYYFPQEVYRRGSNRIINEIRGINRVTYDISSKPPATIEWE